MALTRTDILRHQRRRSVLVAVVMVGLCGAILIPAGPCAAQGGRLGDYRITAVANPRSVPADGKSAARIRIDVTDSQGRPAPDDTDVVVTTDLGRLGESDFERSKAVTVKTSAGFAIVLATSDTPGLATVRIRVGASGSNNVYLEFRPEGEEAGQ